MRLSAGSPSGACRPIEVAFKPSFCPIDSARALLQMLPWHTNTSRLLASGLCCTNVASLCHVSWCQKKRIKPFLEPYFDWIECIGIKYRIIQIINV